MISAKERMERAESIYKRQQSGEISKWEASAEFDKMLDESTGDLHFFSDTTCFQDEWMGRKVMVMTRGLDTRVPWSRRQPSNTGLVTQGPERGLVVLRPGETETDADTVQLGYWGRPGERRWSPRTFAGGIEPTGKPATGEVHRTPAFSFEKR